MESGGNISIDKNGQNGMKLSRPDDFKRNCFFVHVQK